MYGITLRVWGDSACFTRPEMKVERVTYDVITPSAARGILEAIHWKPAIRWVIDEIWVMKPIAYSNIRRNEVSDVVSFSEVKSCIKSVSNSGSAAPLYLDSQDKRQQRATLYLKDVEYLIQAHFLMTDKTGDDDTADKHYNISLRRARRGQCYHKPYFGCREYPVNFELVEDISLFTPISESRDLGWMLYDIDFKRDMEPRFFRAQMHEGIVSIPTVLHTEVNV